MSSKNIVEVPNGWLDCSLGEVVDYGKTQKADMASLNPNTWVLELEDIEKKSSKILKKITFEVRESKSAKNIFSKGDVLYGKLRPYLNKVVIADDNGVCSSEIVPISCDKELIGTRYLFYWLKNSKFLAYVDYVSYGVNMPRLGTNDGKKAPMRLAPIAEQKRIVEKLDNLLAQVDTIQQRLNTLPNIIKRFRQSVLAAAVSGKFTEQWRENNDYSAPDQLKLLEFEENQYLDKKLKDDKTKILKEKKKLRTENVCFQQNDAPSGWEITPFFEFCLLNRGFDLPTSKRADGDYPIMSSGGFIGFHEEYKVEAPVITVGRSGSVGKVFFSEKNSWPLNTSLYVKDFGISEPYYVYLALKHFNLARFASSSAVPSLNRNEFMFIEVYLPPREEQTEIVRLVEQYFALADTLEKNLKNAKQRVDNLTQSILAKAFKGELVPQDPSDEPADKLLARIKAARTEAEALEKAATLAKKKARKT